MASNHLTTKPLARAKGGNAVHTAAYILRTRLEDERTGRVWDYSRKAEDVLFAGRFVPKGAAAWMMDTGQLWNGAERAETKSNARTGRVLQIGLHHELTLEQNLWVLKDFVRENFTRKGIAAEVAVHRPGEGDERNIHAHVLLTTRFAGRDGLGEKDRDSNRTDVLRSWRNDWEQRSNKALERHGHEARISMQTLTSQGIERTPETHLGKVAAALERKGIGTSRGDDLREVRAERRVRAMLHELEPVAVMSAVERMREEEYAERREAVRQNAQDIRRGTSLPVHVRDMMAACKRLFLTLGHSFTNVVTIDPGDLRGQGRLIRAELVDERRQQAERDGVRLKPAPMPPRPRERTPEPEPPKRETLLAKLEREAKERGEKLEVELRPKRERPLERILERRPRRPGDPDDPYY